MSIENALIAELTFGGLPLVSAAPVAIPEMGSVADVNSGRAKDRIRREQDQSPGSCRQVQLGWGENAEES